MEQSQQQRAYGFQRGVSGNPGGGRAHAERIERKAHELAAEFGGYDALSAIDRALILQAARLLHRRTHGTDDAVRTANAVTRALALVRRYRPAVGNKAQKPLRERLAAGPGA